MFIYEKSIFSQKFGQGLQRLNVVGLSFHVGSGQQTVDAYIDALDRARSVFDVVESLGIKFKVLDIGDGFPKMIKIMERTVVDGQITFIISTTYIGSFDNIPYDHAFLFQCL